MQPKGSELSVLQHTKLLTKMDQTHIRLSILNYWDVTSLVPCTAFGLTSKSASAQDPLSCLRAKSSPGCLLHHTCLRHSSDKLGCVHLPQWRTVYVYSNSLGSLEKVSIQYMPCNLTTWQYLCYQIESNYGGGIKTPIKYHTKLSALDSVLSRLTFAVHLGCGELFELCDQCSSKNLLVIHNVGSRSALHPDREVPRH